MTYGYNTAINIDKGVQLVILQIISIMMMAGLKIGMSEPGHYDGNVLRLNPGLQYPHLHGPVHTPDNNRWDTPPV